MEDDDLLKKYNTLYLEMLMRYKEEIEKGEMLYVAELPRLVTPQDDAVLAVVNNIKSSFASYSFNDNFYDAAMKAQAYIDTSVSSISAPVQFWLMPSEVIRMGAGDAFDKTVLLCSMLIGLGNISAKIITVVKDAASESAAYCEFHSKLLLMRSGSGLQEFGSKQELLAAMGFAEDTNITAYEFNDKMYSSIA